MPESTEMGFTAIFTKDMFQLHRPTAPLIYTTRSTQQTLSMRYAAETDHRLRGRMFELQEALGKTQLWIARKAVKIKESPNLYKSGYVTNVVGVKNTISDVMRQCQLVQIAEVT